MKIAVPATIVISLLTFALIGDTRAATAVLGLIVCCCILCVAVFLRLGPAEQPAAPVEPRNTTVHELYLLRSGRCPACGGSDFVVSGVVDPIVRLQCENKHVWFVRFDNHEIDQAYQVGDSI